MKGQLTYCLFLLLLISQISFSKDYKVGNILEFDETVKLLRPGDRLIMKNGEWKDVDLRIKARGSKNKPIYLMGETPGKVIITGNSSLGLAGEYIEVQGLWFKDGFTTEKAVISFRVDSSSFARNSRVSNCAVTNYNPQDSKTKYYYFEFWGQNNRLVNSEFSGKNNEGPTIVVWLNSTEHRNNNHIISNNYFGERPPLGRNGGETIRIGTSQNSLFDSCTIIEKNVFEKCNGESEIISNKSGKNKFRYNLFLESQGALVLRHGDNAIVDSNVFDGKNKKWTGGVRVINEGHLIRNNLFMNLTGEEFKSPFVIMNGVPNSPLNRYRQVKDVDIQFNTFINCSMLQFGAGKDEEKSLAPVNTIFANNLFLRAPNKKIYRKHADLTGIQFRNNKILGSEDRKRKGFSNILIEADAFSELGAPIFLKESLKAIEIGQGLPKCDLTDNPRRRRYVGAFEPKNLSLPVALNLKVGTDWLKSN